MTWQLLSLVYFNFLNIQSAIYTLCLLVYRMIVKSEAVLMHPKSYVDDKFCLCLLSSAVIDKLFVLIYARNKRIMRVLGAFFPLLHIDSSEVP